jgi:hypothetical protein
MRYTRFVSSVLLSVLLVTLAVGQTSRKASRKITADIPFDFMVDQSMFPAGQYVITQAGDRTFHLQAKRGLESATFTIHPTAALSYGHTSRVAFAEHNGHFQLRELWINSQIGGELSGRSTLQLRTVRVSRIEVEADCTSCE